MEDTLAPAPCSDSTECLMLRRHLLPPWRLDALGLPPTVRNGQCQDSRALDVLREENPCPAHKEVCSLPEQDALCLLGAVLLIPALHQKAGCLGC